MYIKKLINKNYVYEKVGLNWLGPVLISFKFSVNLGNRNRFLLRFKATELEKKTGPQFGPVRFRFFFGSYGLDL